LEDCTSLPEQPYQSQRLQTNFSPTILSKIYKKVLKQLINHVEVNIYNNTQSGFRKGHSTATLLLKLQDGIKKAMNRGEISLAVS